MTSHFRERERERGMIDIIIFFSLSPLFLALSLCIIFQVIIKIFIFWMMCLVTIFLCIIVYST